MITELLKAIDSYGGSWEFAPEREPHFEANDYWVEMTLDYLSSGLDERYDVRCKDVEIFDENDNEVTLTAPEKEIILKKINRNIYTEAINTDEYDDSDAYDIWRDHQNF